MPVEACAPVSVPADDHEPVGWLKATAPDQAERILPLFRRPATIVVGRDAQCDWRFDGGLAPEQVRLSWDGVALLAEELDPAGATRLAGTPLGDGPARVSPEQALTAGDLWIVLEVLYHSNEVTELRLPAEPAPVETVAVETSAVETVPAEPPVPSRALLYEPPRNHARDDEPTAEWPLADALAPSPDLLDRLSRRGVVAVARSLPRRRVLLYLVLIAVVGVEVVLLTQPRSAPAPAAASSEPRGPRVVAPAPRGRAMLPDKSLEVALREGIEAYRRGRTAEALERFTKIVDETADPAARMMVFVLRSRGAVAP
jgi:hypothetical protein